MNTKSNPLSKYFRKPTIYVQIPTGGRFNPEIDKTILDEIPIMPMTAIDEISMSNPDELLNGEALVNLITSCVPTIPEPRNLCNIDADFLYLAIKHATYGKNIEHTHTCSNCEEQADYNIDINSILDKFPEIHEVEPVEYKDLKIYVHPPKMESMTRMALIEVEQTRILDAISDTGDESITEIELAKQFALSFRKVSKQNVNLLIEAIDRIETLDEVVTDKDTILEFMDNCETKVITRINDQITKVNNRPKDLTTFEFTCDACDNKEKVRFELNPVNFSSAG
jgi:hypothetical protein